MTDAVVVRQKNGLDVVLVAVVCALGALVAVEGAHTASLASRTPLSPKELYAQLAQKNVRLQIVDVRGDDEYADQHIPGALPFPGCDDAKTPAAAQARILSSVPTIIVTKEGAADAPLLETCRARFRSSTVLSGGMAAWDDASLPEDSGEYTAPKASAGGGCL